ncbi:hypothetical protein JTE90_019467 [Oedothorax gibbosus]|uniref:Sec20 C-terminal domain-containing protein n=1 Tax=Oedothorax gibbosus TaxID=931172 RepID=A0AAV6UVH0_9ARAC|nr:hypothetical protein JTE90_019467 [Oedothorax gibbosus]
MFWSSDARPRNNGVRGASDESTVQLIRQEILQSDLRVKALVQDIRECEGPCDVLNGLNTRVSENMKCMKQGIEELETIAREQDRESDRLSMFKEVEKHQKQYAANQFALRRANLSCQALLDRANREELLTGPSEPQTGQPRRRADKDSLSKQASSITESLVALGSMMAAQVKQSEESLHALIGSSQVVGDTGEELKSMGGVLRHSRTLLQKYGRREVTDRILVVLAVLFFIACMAYVTVRSSRPWAGSYATPGHSSRSKVTDRILLMVLAVLFFIACMAYVISTKRGHKSLTKGSSEREVRNRLNMVLAMHRMFSIHGTRERLYFEAACLELSTFSAHG